MITVTALRRVPPFAQGVVRDLRVRWALHEAGLPYQARLLSIAELGSSTYRGQQPFGQVPAYEEDGLVLFESGAIVLHISARSAALLPTDERGRARAVAWVFAALNSIETVVQPLAELDVFYAAEPWAREARPVLEQRVRLRLRELAACLGDRAHLEDRFTAADLMMTTVLRILRHTQLVAAEPVLAAYQARCEARPAFQRALQEQLADFA
jgi:glutathione S-transferase